MLDLFDLDALIARVPQGSAIAALKPFARRYIDLLGPERSENGPVK